MSKFLLFLIAIGLSACEKKVNFTHWQKDGIKNDSDQINFNKRLAPLTDINLVTPVKWGSVSIFRSEQRHNSVSIDGSDLRWVVDDGRDVFFGSLHYIEVPDKTMDTNAAGVEKFKELNQPQKIPLLRGESLLYYDYKWATILGKPKLYLVAYIEDKQQVRKKMFRYGVLSKQETVSSGFQNSQIRIFPFGPKWSVLTEMPISIFPNEPLSSDHLLVVSDAEKSIEKIEPIMKFDVSDERFDQIQVYYFLQKSLEFQKNTLGFQSAALLKARVHVGFPDKTNTAFYFQNQIRLGQGDDVYFSQMSRDPSIVFHESMHFLIDQVAGLPFQGEGGSINEGFADFYTAVALKKATLGDSSYLKGPYKRSIANIVKYSEKSGGLYHDSAIVSSLLWQIKETLGESTALDISKDVLVRLSLYSDLESFSEQIQKTARSHREWDKIKLILIKMDFPMESL